MLLVDRRPEDALASPRRRSIPAATPSATGRMPSRNTIRLICAAAAPSAIRTPISRVRKSDASEPARRRVRSSTGSSVSSPSCPRAPPRNVRRRTASRRPRLRDRSCRCPTSGSAMRSASCSALAAAAGLPVVRATSAKFSAARLGERHVDEMIASLRQPAGIGLARHANDGERHRGTAHPFVQRDRSADRRVERCRRTASRSIR